MNLTNSELQSLRSQPHRTDLYLSIYRPNTIMTAQVTGTYSTGDTTISFYNVSGSYFNLHPDLTVMVGTTPSTDDIARIRLRMASGTYFVAAENGITWQNGQYLTFLEYIDIEAIYPKIIQDPNNQTNVIFYKDGDIPYSNQNTIYGTFPNAGPHRALFLESGTATTYYTATGTYNVAGSALTYSWAFQGGTPTGSTAITPGNVTYSQAGHYITRLITTAANGAVDTTYRYVSVYDRIGRGTNTPTLKWELQNFSGSRSEGGYNASFKVWENIGAVQPNALVVIFADTWYGGTKRGIGGNAQNNQSIIFVGYILEDTIRFDWQKSSVEFTCGSVSEVMKNAEGFSVSCESKASPTTWFELQEMTIEKAVYHYLKWHSTVLRVTDFQYLNDDRLVQYFDADRGSMYDAVDSFLRDGLLGSLISDRQGKLWGEISSFGLETPFTTIPNYFTVHKQDWMDAPTIKERRNSELSLIELGGIAYYGVTTNGFSALIANAPSTAPLYYGKSDRKEGLILISQTQLNNVSGNYLAHYNTRFPDVNMGLAGTYLNLDIAPQERLYLVIDQNDTVANKSLQRFPYIVESMDWKYDSRNETFNPEITLTQIATGTPGVTVQIPAVSPDDGYTLPDLSLPPIPNFGNTTPVGSTVPVLVIIEDGNVGLLYSPDFDQPSPSWLFWNAGLTQQQRQLVNLLFRTPNGTYYCAYISNRNVFSSPSTAPNFIARATSLGSPWTVIYSKDNLSSGASHWGIYGGNFNPLLPDTVGFVIANASDSVPKMYIGTAGTFSVGSAVAAADFSYSIYVSFYNNQWLLTTLKQSGGQDVKVVSANGGTVTSRATPADIDRPHIRGSATGKVLVQGPFAGSTLYTSSDNFATYTAIDTSPTFIPFYDEAEEAVYADCDPNCTYIMTRGGAGGRLRSSDGGFSWGAIANLPVGVWWFSYAGGSGISSRFVAAGGSSVRFSPDFGNTWINKEGSLTTLVPLPTITMVKAII